MKPKEKAKEIYNKFIHMESWCDDGKECALIAVDEIRKAFDDVLLPNPFGQYWQEVKQEVKNL